MTSRHAGFPLASHAVVQVVSTILASATLACSDGGSGGSDVTEQTGSTARFAVVGEYLYVLNQDSQTGNNSTTAVDGALAGDVVDTYSLANPEAPSAVQRTDLPFGAQTLFAAGSNLFIGGSTSMAIVSIAKPEAPELLSTTVHFPAKDPVVVAGDTAYVTLRMRSPDDDVQDGLQIYDVSVLTNPVLIGSFAMTSPWGLSVRHDRAYVCDGSAGLKVLSVATPSAVQQLAQVDTNICFDALATDSLLITTGAAGVLQYRIDPATDAPVQLSAIPLQSP